MPIKSGFPTAYSCLEMYHTIGYSSGSLALFTTEVLEQRLPVLRVESQLLLYHSCELSLTLPIPYNLSDILTYGSGDQPFWGHMVARAGAGPPPIAYKDLSSDALAKSIDEALKPASIERAKEMADKISSEKGSEVGAQSFHRELDIDKLRCQLCPARTAVWRLKRTEVRLSAFAATVLANEGQLDFKDLKLYRPREYDTEEGPWDPITGGASAIVGTMGSMAMGIADLPVAALKAMKIHPDAQDPNRKSKRRTTQTSNDNPKPPRDRQSQRSDAVKDELRKPSSKDSSRSASPAGEEQAFAQAIGSQLATQTAEASSQTQNQQSSSPPQNQSTLPPNAAAKPQFDVESALSTTHGALRFASAGVKSPMDFTLSLARGFHNAPKLYNDDTVRKPPKINDFSSGVKAAGQELGYGFYDGVSGLVTQPLEGAKKEGLPGFVKGMGKGFGGLILKPGAGIWGVPGYTSKGIYKELTSRFGASVEGYIIAARTAQGYEDMRNSDIRERAFVIEDWKEMKRYVYKKKSPGEGQFKELCDRIFARSERDHAQKEKAKGADLERTETTATTSSGIYSPAEDDSVDLDPLSRVHTAQRAATQAALAAQGSSQEDAEMEAAILRSVAQTSRGDPEEDAVVERAIRSSLKEMRQSGQPMPTGKHEIAGEHEEGLSRALAMSREEHEKNLADEESAKREEEIVMRHVLRQSEYEEKMRRDRQG